MFATKFGMVIAGLMGLGLLIIGLISLGLTAAPRPSYLTSETYAKMRQLEYVVAIIFLPLGMWVVRTVVKRFSKPAEGPTPTENGS